MKTAYLDNSATTRLDPRVQEVILKTFSDVYGNPSSLHGPGRAARRTVDNARERIAGLLGVDEKEILFTSGATEANNLVFQGLPENRGKHIVTTRVEHPSVSEVCSSLEKHGWEITRLPVNREGRVQPADLLSAVRSDTALVSVMWANNEVGTIQPLDEIAGKVQVPLHSDAAQALGKTPVSLEGMDFLTFSGHKLHGPKGIGGLFHRKGTHLKPLLLGGGQEFEKRGGTENVALIAGFAEAMDLSVRNQSENRRKMADARDKLAGCLRGLPDVSILGAESNGLPNILNACFDGADAEALVLALDAEGVHVSSGSACSSLSTEPSPVLLAMGFSIEEAKTSLRFSVAADTAAEEIEHAMEVIPRIVKRLRGYSEKKRNE